MRHGQPQYVHLTMNAIWAKQARTRRRNRRLVLCLFVGGMAVIGMAVGWQLAVWECRAAAQATP